MGACRALLALSLAAAAVLWGLLMVPSVEDEVAKVVFGNLVGWPLTIFGSLVVFRHFAYCLGDYLGCVKGEIAEDLVKLYTWEGGVGEIVSFSVGHLVRGQGNMPVFFSHEAYRSWAHAPDAGRPADAFIFANKNDLPDGVMPSDGNILLNFDTGTTEHTARRTLLADALPGLAQTEKSLVLAVPPLRVPAVALTKAALKGGGFGDLKRGIFDCVGYNVFSELFGIDISENLADHFEYDGILAPGVIGMPILAFQGRRLEEIRARILKKAVESKIGREFIELAKARGMDGAVRLEEAVWIAMFAGYGGTGNLAFETFKFILKDPEKRAALYRKDPKAFMLEAARLFPPVGGMNPVAYRKTVKHKLANGVTLEKRPGDMGIILSSGSNHDPSVFNNPEAFIPGRANASKVLSWNNEVGEFAKCKTIAGCPEAPRGCPGTWLSYRVATAVVGHFLEGIDGISVPQRSRDEL